MYQENQLMNKHPIDPAEIRSAQEFAILWGGIVSGSVIVHPLHANDIDIFLPESTFFGNAAAEQAGFIPYDPLEGDPKYEEAVRYQEIVRLYRKGVWNLIIVGHDFWPAYKYAARELAASPHKYVIKKDRQNLFIRAKNIIHKMRGTDERPLME